MHSSSLQQFIFTVNGCLWCFDIVGLGIMKDIQPVQKTVLICAGGGVVTRALHVLQLQNFDSITSSIISCCIKLQNDLTFYNQLTKVILECWQLNECYFC